MYRSYRRCRRNRWPPFSSVSVAAVVRCHIIRCYNVQLVMSYSLEIVMPHLVVSTGCVGDRQTDRHLVHRAIKTN